MLARKTFRCRAWDLGVALDWAAGRAAGKGRDLLDCVWPAVLDTAQQPFRAHTWIAALGVVVERDGGDLARTRRLAGRGSSGCPPVNHHAGQAETLSADRPSHLRCARPPAGVTAHRAGALERVALLLEDWHYAHQRLADTEMRMIAVLDELGLSELVASITGISPIGAAAILAQTGDLRRFTTARAVVKHAGLAPRQKLSGNFVGRTKLTGQGRPGLRLAAWRAVWGAQRANPV